MLVHKTVSPVQFENVLTEEKNFTIKATGKAFQILSSGLYSDKPLAIIRELSCNAYDAHIAAGKVDVPFEITLPTYLNPTFQVKDFGTGLDHEDVLHLYTTYFDSTKQDSNDFIGALGLGSKSPFSYSTTFLVASRFNGTLRTYSCYLNEYGCPAIVQLSEHETDEENGLTITISVDPHDCGKFINAASIALAYFDPAPVIVGKDDFKRRVVKYDVAGSGWKMRVEDPNSTTYFASKGPRVVQGIVAYPIDTSILSAHVSTQAKTVFNTNVDLFVDIGIVDVAASREALSYDPRTIKNLSEIFDRIADELHDVFQREFTACPSYYDACSLFVKYQSGEFRDFGELLTRMHKQQPFVWTDGKEVGSTIDITFLDDFTVMTAVKRDRWQTKKVGTHRINKSDATFRIRPRTIVVSKEGSRTIAFVRQYLLGAGYKSDKAVLVFHTSKKAEYDQRSVDHILAQLGNPEYLRLEEIVDTTNKRTTSNKRAKDTRLVWTGFVEKQKSGYYGTKYIHRVFSRLTWSHDTVDVENDGGFYVPVDRFTVNAPIGGVCTDFDRLIAAAQRLQLVPMNIRVFGFTSKEIGSLPEENDWINLFDYIKLKYDQMHNDDTVEIALVKTRVNSLIPGFWKEHYIDNWTTMSSQLTDGTFKRVLSKLVDITSTTLQYSIEDVALVEQIYGLTRTDVDQLTDDLMKEWNNLFEDHYPLLTLVDTYWAKQKLHLLNDYIKLVDNSTESSV